MPKKTKPTSKKDRPEKRTKLQRFGLFFFDHFKTTLVLWVAFVVFGVLGYTSLLKREGFPSLELPMTVVNGTYFVDDSGRVDREVAQPLTELAQRQPNVKSVNASTGDNFYMLQVEFKDGTNASDANKKLEEAAKAEGVLPEQASAEFRPLAFGVDPDNQGDDLLIAFFSKKDDVDTEALNTKLQEAVAFLQSDGTLNQSVERVRSIELYRNGTDPATGQTVRQQKAFDRIGVKNGQVEFYQAGEIALKARPGVDELHLYDRTQEALERLRKDAAFQDFDVVISANTAEGVRTQIDSLQENLLGGLAAVIIVSFLLISLRASIVTALAMTTVLAITLVALYAADYSLNTITLFSLILCLGLIVDDTTIMVEAIDAGRKSRKPRRQIVAEAIKRVARASTAGTITTMLGFAPLLFIGGFLGDIIWGIPVTIIISLAVSLLVSLSVVPFMARFLVREGKQGEGWSPLKGVESFLSQRIASAIRMGKRSRRKLTVVGVTAIIFSLVLTAAGGALFSKLKFNIFPATKDSDALILSLKFPEGTDITTAQTLTDEVDDITAGELGENLKQASLYASGSDTQATLYLQLISYKERDATSVQMIDQLKNRFKDYGKAAVSVQQGDVGPPAGVFAARIFYDGERDKALALAKDVHSFLDKREFERPDGSTFHIEQARVTPENSHLRVDGKPYVQVEAGFDATDTTALVTIAQDAVEKEFPESRVESYGLAHDAMSFDFGSESENQESFQAMLIAFPLLLVAMYLLLAVQFRSLLQPLLIFVALPFSLFGITGGLYLTDNPFSFFTLIGVFALIGISVNNTILLTDFANQARANGERRIDAIAGAVQARFRPLLTTSLTSVVALTPLALSDPFWESLAVTLIFGLLSSTFLVIVAFPYYYLASEFLRARFVRRHVLVWLAALIGGGVLFVALDRSYYLPLWLLICILFSPLHAASRRFLRARAK